MSKREKEVIVLPQEHMYLLNHIKRIQGTGFTPFAVFQTKNTSESIKCRQIGNDMYKRKDYHNSETHMQIWRTYTQSIALAPNNTEELAYGYGNRSALLFHLEEFEESIKDCDQALTITQSDLLKIKLLTRKAECLFLLDQPTTAKDVSNEALELLINVKLDDQVTKTYKDKLKKTSSGSNVFVCSEKVCKKDNSKKYIEELSSFPRSQEASCASKSVAIHYNKKWGRHLVAAEDIRPGDIIALEKIYYTFICSDGLYLFCSNCAKYAWSSIPCQNCIYDVYCSESCRSEAWDKYHQWECAVYPFMWDIVDKDRTTVFPAMRLVLIGINEIGGIDNMKKMLMDLDKSTDHRTKGFSDGIFQTDSIKSIYSLTKRCIEKDSDEQLAFAGWFCWTVELLGRHTNFFGQQINGSGSTIFQNKDVLFVAALMLRAFNIIHNNAEYPTSIEGNTVHRYAVSVTAFSSLINHSCDPNICALIGQDNIKFCFAVKPIKKGTQLLKSYFGSFMLKSKDDRQTYLESAYNIKCQCLPCKENWSNICLPTIAAICEITPQLNESLFEIYPILSKMRELKSENLTYSPKMMQDLVFLLESIAQKFSVYTQDYESCIEILEKLLLDVFGSFYFSISNDCFTSYDSISIHRNVNLKDLSELLVNKDLNRE